jgi:hypothetical protein
MKPLQESLASRIARDNRPLHEWADDIGRLRAHLYEKDSELSRRLEKFLVNMVFAAADLDCIGTNDPTAPAVGAPTEDVLAYFFRLWPKDGSEFRRLIARADQLLGRRRVLEVLGMTEGSSKAAESQRRE